MSGTRPWRSRRRRFYGVPLEKIREALASFRASHGRQEVRGEARGVKVIDDFGHHPTAISQTLMALRHRYAGHRLWAVFEPRSNTTRRAVFQEELPEALKLADGVFIAQVAGLDQIAEVERLNPEAVVRRSRTRVARPSTSRMRRTLSIGSCRFCSRTISSWSSAMAGSTAFTRRSWKS